MGPLDPESGLSHRATRLGGVINEKTIHEHVDLEPSQGDKDRAGTPGRMGAYMCQHLHCALGHNLVPWGYRKSKIYLFIFTNKMREIDRAKKGYLLR